MLNVLKKISKKIDYFISNISEVTKAYLYVSIILLVSVGFGFLIFLLTQTSVIVPNTLNTVISNKSEDILKSNFNDKDISQKEYEQIVTIIVKEPITRLFRTTEKKAIVEKEAIAQNEVKILSLNEIKNQNPLTLLVDKKNRLPEEYIPRDLSYVNVFGGGYLVYNAKIATEKLFKYAKERGYNLKLNSSYRSYKDQEIAFRAWKNITYTNGAKNEAEAEYKANQFAAYPGFSEHQLGTAIDIGCDTCYTLNDESSKKLYKFLEENAHKFGFKQSYPENNIKGFGYEPWHWRYWGE